MTDDLHRWQDAAIRLLGLLCSIDKADNARGLSDHQFREIARRLVSRRHSVLVTDGVTVDFPPQETQRAGPG